MLPAKRSSEHDAMEEDTLPDTQSSSSSQESLLEIQGVKYSVDDLYTEGEVSERYARKFRSKQIDTEINILPLYELAESPEDTFDRILQRVIDKNKPSDMINPYISLCAMRDDSTKPYYLRFTKYEDAVPEMIRREMERSAQSGSTPEPLAGQNLFIKMTWIDMPRASGKRTYGTMEDSDNITHVLGTKLCLAKAIAIGISYIEKGIDENHLSMWRSISRSEKIQEGEAKEIMRQAGITKDVDYEVEDVNAFQRALPQFQLILLHGSKHRTPMFRGPFVGEKNIIGLRLKNGHIDHIKRVSSFFGSHYYCSACDVVYNNKNSHYNCARRCRQCRHDDLADCVGTEEIFCEDCHRKFTTQSCFNRHKERGPRGGKSACESVDICEKCGEEKHEKRKGREHQCHTAYCKDCMTDRPKGHTTCFVSPLPPLSEKFVKKSIAFDFESTTTVEGGKNIHKPNLIRAFRSCSKCEVNVPKDEDEQLECSECGGKKVWEWSALEGEKNILAEFCDWLFSPVNKGVTAMAHNLQSYDGQFILRHLASTDTPLAPEDFILNGRKLIYLQAKGVRLIDTLSFLVMPLSAFPKTFDIKEFKKGFFPHFFNKSKNYNYVGPLPRIEEYGNLKRMKRAARKELEEWHAAHKNDHFDFRKEIRAYCHADVCLLHEAVRRFDADCFVETGVHVFHEAKTSASAAMMVLRRKFLKEDILAIEKKEDVEERQSLFALKYLSWLRQKEGLDIQDERNGGEHRIPGTKIHVDGFIPPSRKSPRGTAYEIEGCYYHMCPCTYTDEHVMHGRTAYEVRQDDRVRHAKIREHHDLEIIKECEVKKMMREDDELRNYMRECEIEDPLKVNDAFFGGRTEPMKLYCKAGEGERILYADVVSLYPTTNKYRPYPIGLGRKIAGDTVKVPITKKEDLNIKGFVKCKVLPPSNLFTPILTMRSHGKNVVPLCRTCAETLDPYGDECTHSEEERCLKGTFTSFELQSALDVGYTILKVFEARHYDKWSQYKRNADGSVEHGVLSAYMDTWIKKKAEASGWPREGMTDEQKNAYITEYAMREGIILDPAKIKKNPAARAVAKLLANSLWGKLGERNDRRRNAIFVDPAAYFKLLTDASKEVVDIEILTDEKVAVVYRDRSDDLDPIPTTSKASAVLTTGFARCTLFDILQRIKAERLLYCDTDSVLYLHKDDEENPLEDLMGEFLGMMTDELPPGSRCIEFVAQGPKAYGYRVIMPNGEIKETVKCRGFPLTCEAAEKIRFDQMKDFVECLSRGEETEKIPIEYDVFGITKEHNVFTSTVKKNFSARFDKRKIVKGTFETLPYGYRGSGALSSQLSDMSL